ERGDAVSAGASSCPPIQFGGEPPGEFRRAGRIEMESVAEPLVTDPGAGIDQPNSGSTPVLREALLSHSLDARRIPGAEFARLGQPNHGDGDAGGAAIVE